MSIRIPERLAGACRGNEERAGWLERLPRTIEEVATRWRLTLGGVFEEASCAWVAAATCSDGAHAVLKVGMPHMESEQETDGLRFWNGDPTVFLLAADEALGAMLLERCEPGTPLRSLPEPEQDVVIAGLLQRLWRVPAGSHRFRHLSVMTAAWAAETMATEERWKDDVLVREGLRLLRELSLSAPRHVLLATDLHAGNVLRARREPWLVIDPKPFVGDPAYDLTQHLFNCEERLRADPGGTIRRVADLAGVEEERVRLWTFARAATEGWEVARALAR